MITLFTLAGRIPFISSYVKPKYNFGNYDGDDYENCDDYDPDEDLHMMYDEEDYAEQHEG